MAVKGINLRKRYVGREATVYLMGYREDAVKGVIEYKPRGWKGGLSRNFVVDGLRIWINDEIELAPKPKPVPVVKQATDLTDDDLGKEVSVDASRGPLGLSFPLTGTLGRNNSYSGGPSFVRFSVEGTALTPTDVVTFI